MLRRWITRASIFAIVFQCAAWQLQAAEMSSWSFEKDAGGWKGNQQCELEVKDGTLRVKSSGNDPYLITDAKGPAGWIELSIRAKVDVRCGAQLFWSTQKRDGFAEDQSVRFDMRPAKDEERTYTTFFKADGSLKELRFDPHNAKCLLQISAITLTQKEPPPPPKPMATPVDALKIQKDFRVELLYSVPPDEHGSWVSLTHDDKGRLITCDQSGSLYRVTVPDSEGKPSDAKIEKIDVDLGMAQGLLYAFDSLYVVVNDYRGPKSGLYRVKDTNGDDKFDEVKQLKKFDGGGEHGPHAVILGPDKKSLYVCAGNHTNLFDVDSSLVPRNWEEDQLLTRMWDAGGHAVGKLAPGGWIVRTDPEGAKFELVSSGFRNEYDIAFNTAGELFTYDADMEWDVGSPWYRPTRINHVTAGSEFGWRSGTGKWPEYSPDSLGSVVDIGPGSPTGIVFGTGAKFPAKYQRALFIADWSYGKIYAVHMEEDGATHRGTAEQFIAASPLPVTDMVVNPADGALYFAIGGRGTQSGLYRVTYKGSDSTVPVPNTTTPPSAPVRKRRQLEAAIGEESPAVIDRALASLSSEDRHVRFASRIVLEHIEPTKWQKQALAIEDPRGAITGVVGLARTAKKDVQSALLKKLNAQNLGSLPRSQKLAALRAYGLAFIRMGKPADDDRAAVLAKIDGLYPAKDPFVNRELCQLLVYLAAPKVADRTLKLLADAATQEEQIAYVLALRELESGWTDETRETYFKWFAEASMLSGGNSFSRFLVNIRNDAIAKLDDDAKKKLGDLLTAKPVGEVSKLPPRKFVKKWTVDELLPIVEQGLSGRDFANGRRLFTQGACFKCHRFAGQGGIVGPDLTGVAGRFNAKNMLESIVDPSKVVSDQYQSTQFVLDSGKSVIGRIVNAGGDRLMVMTDMMNPNNLATVTREEIEAMKASTVSLMPTGLLDTYNEDEILDMLAYLKSGGDPEHELYAMVAKPKRKNVLLISIDDMNDWVGCLGGHPRAKTPHIDGLARRGTLFKNAHCQAPVCTPSRASMMTGRLPSSTRLYFLQPHLRASEITKKSVTLAEHFAANGYQTIGVGKVYGGREVTYFQEYGGNFGGFGPRPAKKISHPDGHPLWDWGAHPKTDAEMPDHQIADWAIERMKSKSEAPFFMAVGFYRPHVPMYAPPSWFDMHPRESIKLPDVFAKDRDDLSQYAKDLTDGFPAPRHAEIVGEGQWKHAVQSYLASCSFTDHCVGRVLDGLQKSGHADNTIIVLFSDHGWHLGEKERWAKRSLWEDATRVPLIIAGTGHKVSESQRPVGLIDVYPTLADLCDLPLKSELDGQSLRGLLEDPSAEWRPAITTFGPNNHAVRSTDWRYIQYADGSEELYDHREDPHEWHNVVDEKAHEDVIEEHRRWLPIKNLPAMMDVDSYGMKAYREADAGRRSRTP